MASIPDPRDTDADDVSMKLQVAQTQWARGDHAEALKWLRKAADAAFDADDDKRGIELSKLAAELAAQDKAAPKPKPKLPAPRDPISHARVEPAQPAPQARTAAPQPAITRPSESSDSPRRTNEQKLSSTGARRAAMRGAVPRSSASSSKPEEATAPGSRPAARRASRRSSHDLDDESTREYLVADVVRTRPADLAKTRVAASPSSGTDEEWPTESVDNFEELESAPEPAPQKSAPAARRPDSRRRSADSTDVHPTIPSDSDVPFTQALRVAVGRAPDGRIVVRLLDSNGLRAGERDAVLVGLTGEPLTSLFS